MTQAVALGTAVLIGFLIISAAWDQYEIRVARKRRRH